jgi:D-methionine transport system ATP-binding protein
MAILEQGKVIACGDTEELFMHPPRGLQHFIRDEYTVMPEGINLRVVFPSRTAEQSIIADIARETGADFSIIGGQIERYRDDMLGILMLNVQQQHFEVVVNALTAHDLIWEKMEDVDNP